MTVTESIVIYSHLYIYIRQHNSLCVGNFDTHRRRNEKRMREMDSHLKLSAEDIDDHLNENSMKINCLWAKYKKELRN